MAGRVSWVTGADWAVKGRGPTDALRGILKQFSEDTETRSRRIV